MVRLQVLIYLLVICAVFKSIKSEVTEDQMRKTADLMRTICMKKVKVSRDYVDDLRDGIFTDDRDLKCYINCMLDMLNITKRGKINYAAAMRHIEMLVPKHLKDDYRNGVEECKDIGGDLSDRCEAAFKINLCIYEHNPSFYQP